MKDINRDLSEFSEEELAVLCTSPRWDDHSHKYAGCTLMPTPHRREDFENELSTLKIGDLIESMELSPELEKLFFDFTIEDRESKLMPHTDHGHFWTYYFTVVDESCKMRQIPDIQISNKRHLERGEIVIRIPVDVCEKVGMKPSWKINGNGYPTSPQHPIEYYGDQVRYKYKLSTEERKDKDCDHANKGRWDRIFTYELELTFQQYKVAESLPERDGVRSWPSLIEKDGAYCRELETEVKFKLTPASGGNQAWAGTATLILED
jgi:hypothetical protein